MWSEARGDKLAKWKVGDLVEKVTKQYDHYFGKKYTHVSRCTEKYLKVYALKYSVVISGWNGTF